MTLDAGSGLSPRGNGTCQTLYSCWEVQGGPSLGEEAEVFLALKYPVQYLEDVGLMSHVRGKGT